MTAAIDSPDPIARTRGIAAAARRVDGLAAAARRSVGFAAAAVVAAALVGCTTTANQAPMEERALPAKPGLVVPAPAEPVRPAAPTVGGGAADTVAKPGYHTVKPGETLIRIALDNGQNWRDVARWSNLANPNVIEVGQQLRVAPPLGEPTGGAAPRPVVAVAPVESRPLVGAPAASAGVGVAAPVVAAAGMPPVVVATPSSRDAEDDIVWGWPAAGPVTTGFDEARTKGLQFAGRAGEAVAAAADGRVVYAGSGLRGYGNLIIVKHSSAYLTAYAHNQLLLVKEDQPVRRGQKIAEMGSTDADRVQLHFEIRRQGRPIDPTRLLPPR